jgi:hypothetical protein
MRSRVALFGLTVCVLVAGILTAWPGDSQAIPAFARKYETSCQTCHVAFPQLTPFGEAFRRNGYRFPSGTDPDMSKQKDIPLGSEGYKKVFPKAVWPGNLPREMPLAAIAQSELADSPHTKPHVQFDGLGSTFELLAAGTFGETISFFNEVPIEFEDGDFHVGVERAFVVVKPTSRPTLLLRVGRFETGMANVSEHRGLFGDYWLLTRGAGVRADSLSGAGNDFAMEPAQQGFELTGTPGGRFGYTAGVVEGTAGLPNDAKDFYGRAEYKLGGLRLDGVESGEPSALASPKPWLEKSLTVGAFGYLGKTLLGDATPEPEDKFYYAGGDLYANAANFLVRAGYAREHHDAPFEILRESQADVNHLFVEAQHIYYPWLFPMLRYERFSSTIAASGAADVKQHDSRLTPGIVTLIRGNVETIVKADIEKIGDEKWLVQQVGATFAIVF